MATAIWTDEKMYKLIEMYESRDVLYDFRSEGYHNRNKKNCALEEISRELAVPVQEVAKRLRYLRKNFTDERRKMGKSSSGQGRDDLYVSKWKYFSALSFLEEHLASSPAQTTTNLEKVVLKSDKVRLKRKIAESIKVLCRTGLSFKSKFQVEALIGITLDDSEVVLVSFNEVLSSTGVSLSSEVDENVDKEANNLVKGGNGTQGMKTSLKEEVIVTETAEQPSATMSYPTVPVQLFSNLSESCNTHQVGTSSVSWECQTVKEEEEEEEIYDTFTTSFRNHNQDFTEEVDDRGYQMILKTEASDSQDDCMIVKTEQSNEDQCYDTDNDRSWSGHAETFDISEYAHPQNYDSSKVSLPGDNPQHSNWLPRLSESSTAKLKMSLPKRRHCRTVLRNFAKQKRFKPAARLDAEVSHSAVFEAPDSDRDVIGRPVLQCAYCNALFNKSHALKEHVNGVHFKKKLFHCPDCGESFKWRAELSRHRRVPGMCPCGGNEDQEWFE